jgi:hypothetical protein
LGFEEEGEEMSNKVWGMMTEFKFNIDLEKQVIKRDINRIEMHLSKLAESLSLLRNLKRKVESAKKHLKLSKE